MYVTTDYEIRYNTDNHMFDLFFAGVRIDDKLPSYLDGEQAIQLHQAIEDASCACETPMQRAARTVLCRYPNATIGNWRDYIINLAPILSNYAVIAIDGYGYGVHHVRDGFLSDWIETIFAHAPVEA